MAVVLLGTKAWGHGPAPAPLQVLSVSGQASGGFAGDPARPDIVRTSIGLAVSTPDGSYIYRCPSQWGERETALAAATPDRSLVILVGGGQVYVSLDGGCSASPVALPGDGDGYAADVQTWRGQGYVVVRGDGAGELTRIGPDGIASDERQFAEVTPDMVFPFELEDGGGGLLVAGARPTPQVWLGVAGAGSTALTWQQLGGLPDMAGLQRLDVRAVSPSGDGVWIATGEAGGRRLWWGHVSGGGNLTDSPPSWTAGDTLAALLHGPVWLDGHWLSSWDGVSASVLHGPEAATAWTLAGANSWTCLQRVDGVAYACTLPAMVELTNMTDPATPDMTTATRSVWGIQQLGPPDTACLVDDAVLSCNQDWFHFGGESGLVGRAPKTEPRAPFEPYWPDAGPVEAVEAADDISSPTPAPENGGCAGGGLPVSGLPLLLSLLVLLLSGTGCPGKGTTKQDGPPPVDIGGIPPEAATGFRAVAPTTAAKYMVVAANPYASRVGKAMIDAGGSAIDAAVAMQAMLNLVEPQSSGIAGGAFILYHDKATGELHTYDGREKAPAGLNPDAFRKPDGNPMSFPEAVFSARSVGVPGVMKALELAHKEHGKLPWKDLFKPAIKLAREGFPVSKRLHKLISGDPLLGRREGMTGRRYFTRDDGSALPVGHLLRNPRLANSLTGLAAKGSTWLYTDGASYFMEAMQSYGGVMTVSDLALYKPKKRPPVCLTYRARWKVCGMGPPTSGGITTLQILGVLQQFDLSKVKADSAAFAHLFAEASKLAYADRGAYIGDSDFVKVPVNKLLSASYLASRAKLIDPKKASAKAKAGSFPADGAAVPPQDTSIELPSTSHLVVLDKDGDAVSMTTTIESAFGSRIMTAGGFLLNNQMTDFTWYGPSEALKSHPNAIAPGKRPRSSMAPTVVYDMQDNVRLLVGSPGGSRIIGYVARVLALVLDYGIDPQSAIAAPNLSNRNGITELEKRPGMEAWTAKLKADLEAMGHQVAVKDMNSGLHAIAVRSDGSLLGGADPRREGLAVGE